MAKEGCLRAAIEQMQQLIKKPHSEVWEEKKRGVEFAGHNKVKAGIETHLAMVHDNQTDVYFPCQNNTAKNPQASGRRKVTGASPTRLAPPRPGTPPAPPGDSERSQSSETEGVPPRYVYIHTPLPSAQFFNINLYAKDRKCDEDFIPDFMTDKGPSTSKYTICCRVMQLISIL